MIRKDAIAPSLQENVVQQQEQSIQLQQEHQQQQQLDLLMEEQCEDNQGVHSVLITMQFNGTIYQGVLFPSNTSSNTGGNAQPNTNVSQSTAHGAATTDALSTTSTPFNPEGYKSA